MTTAAIVPAPVPFRKSENGADVRCAAACHFSASPPEIAKTTRRTPAAIQNTRERGNLPARTDTSNGHERDHPGSTVLAGDRWSAEERKRPGFCGRARRASDPRQRVTDFIGRFGACK